MVFFINKKKRKRKGKMLNKSVVKRETVIVVLKTHLGYFLILTSVLKKKEDKLNEIMGEKN